MRARMALSFALLLSMLLASIQVLAPTASAQENAANEAVVRRFFEEVLSQGNLELIPELFAPDFVLHQTTDPSGDVVGLEAVAGFVGGARGAFPDLTYTVHELISEGDTVVIRWINQGTNAGPFMGIPATGKPVSITGANVFRVSAGKIVEEWGFPDNLSLLVQLGVVPGGAPASNGTPSATPGDGAAPAATPASADEIRDVATRFWDAYNANDLDAIGSFLAPGFVDRHPTPGFAATAEGVVETVASLRSAFPDQVATPQHIVVEGDLVAVHVVLQGTHQGTVFGIPATGQPVRYGGVQIARVQNGQFVEAWGFYDQVGILAQIGAMGGPPAASAASPIASPQASALIDWEAYSQLAITARDGAIEAPESIEGGLVAITLENAGETNHMAMLIRPKEGVAIDDLEAAIIADPMNQVVLRDMVVSSGGAGGIAPGARQRLVQNIDPGQYLIADFEFAADGTPWVSQGGLKRLEVTAATRTDLPEPAADAVVSMTDFAFNGLPGGVAPGTYVFKVTNDGVEPHELAWVKLAEGVSAQEAFSQVPEPGQPLPFTFWGGVQDMSPGQAAWVEIEFSAGESFG